MTYTMEMWNEQRKAIKAQKAGLRALDGTRITYDGYEYRITYQDNAVMPSFRIDRRLRGGRHFTSFGFVRAFDVDARGALARIRSRIYERNA